MMTTQALERAARALADHFGCEWDTMRDADRETITGYVRAVLMAVRELDDETKQRGSVIYCEGKSGLFTAMIDAILGEGEGE